METIWGRREFSAMCQGSETPWHRQSVIMTQRGIFSPRLFRNHTIAQSQQLARLCVSEPTIWISQALPDRSDSVYTLLGQGCEFHPHFFFLFFFSPLSLTACCYSSRHPQQPSFPCWFFKQGFPWLDATTSSKLMQILAAAQTLQWLCLCYSHEIQEAHWLSLEQLALYSTWGFFFNEGTSSEDHLGETPEISWFQALIPHHIHCSCSSMEFCQKLKQCNFSFTLYWM